MCSLKCPVVLVRGNVTSQLLEASSHQFLLNLLEKCSRPELLLEKLDLQGPATEGKSVQSSQGDERWKTGNAQGQHIHIFLSYVLRAGVM